ncbi:MAG: DUF2802 domain-containing protein [Oceanospirillaceae bacterium]|nr:DUF2802 domain-containing protein [Oceanospirillaceae bacterium]
MELSASQLSLLLAVMIGVLILLLGWLVILSLRLRAQSRKTQALINVVRGEIKAMTTGSIGMGKRLKSIEHRLNLTVEKQHELENRDPTQLAYNQAARLMEMGADVDDLVRNCGIGRPEAELMALLHRELEPGTKPALSKQH